MYVGLVIVFEITTDEGESVFYKINILIALQTSHTNSGLEKTSDAFGFRLLK